MIILDILNLNLVCKTTTIFGCELYIYSQFSLLSIGLNLTDQCHMPSSWFLSVLVAYSIYFLLLVSEEARKFVYIDV